MNDYILLNPALGKGQKLTEGSYGEVRKGKHRISGIEFAVKIILKEHQTILE